MHPSLQIAKQYVESALEYSKDIVIGGGPQGPFDHLMKLKENTLNVSASQPFDPSSLLLYAVTDSRMNKRWGRSITDAVKAALQGGATIIQLRLVHIALIPRFFLIRPSLIYFVKHVSREKDIETRDFLESATECLKICRSHGVPLLINDRIDIALACGADGVHIGQSDMPARAARTLLGPHKIIGVSCKTPQQAEQAWIDGADYIGCGGVYPTNTKANNPVLGLDGLKTVGSSSKLPVVAIGGIGTSNARSVLEFGVPNLKGVAVVSALFDRESVLNETQNLLRVIIDSVN